MAACLLSSPLQPGYRRGVLDGTTIEIGVAIATLIVPAVFLATLALAGRRRSRGLRVGPRMVALVTFLGALSLGLFVGMSGSFTVAWPILGAIVVLPVLLLRRGRRRLAAWFVVGAAVPWTLVWGLYLAVLASGSREFEVGETWLGFAAGAGPLLIALAYLVARRAATEAPAVEAAGDEAAAETTPRGRSFGDIGAAVRAPGLIGPFGLSEVALLVVIVATWLLAGILLPATLPDVVRFAILVVLSTVLGAEAYIRAMPAPAREAFEAFSWLGEWELAQIRALTGEGVPTNELAARRWLRVHPETAETRWLRVEMLTFAGRHDEAKAVAERMPNETPIERFDRAAAEDFADWYSGGDGDVGAMEDAAGMLHPADGDQRLRAEVAIAIARVRRQMAAGDDAIAAGQPLREVRKRLGRRADGQVGRALRLRLIRPLLILGALLAVLSLLVPDLAPLL
jgi:hypothetical protein